MIFSGLTLKDWFHKVIKTPPVCHQNLKNRIEQWRALDFSFFQRIVSSRNAFVTGFQADRIFQSEEQSYPKTARLLVHGPLHCTSHILWLWWVEVVDYLLMYWLLGGLSTDSSCFQTSLRVLLWWFPAPWEWSKFSFPVCTLSKLFPIDQRPIARFFSIS